MQAAKHLQVGRLDDVRLPHKLIPIPLLLAACLAACGNSGQSSGASDASRKCGPPPASLSAEDAAKRSSLPSDPRALLQVTDFEKVCGGSFELTRIETLKDGSLRFYYGSNAGYTFSVTQATDPQVAQNVWARLHSPESNTWGFVPAPEIDKDAMRVPKKDDDNRTVVALYHNGKFVELLTLNLIDPGPLTELMRLAKLRM